MIGMVIGAVLAVAGTIMTVWGHNQQQTYEYQWFKALDVKSEIRGVDAAFYIGVVFLTVGILVLIFAIVKKVTSNKNSINQIKPINNIGSVEQSTFKCTNCGKEMNTRMQFCPECGCSGKVEIKPSSIVSGRNNSVCSNCGTKLSSNETFCHECGARIQSSETV